MLVKIIAVSLTLMASAAYGANQWVVGDPVKLQEYGGYSNAQYEILLDLRNKTWSGTGDGSSVCTERFRIKEGAEGVTLDAKNRMFSMLLAYHMAGKKVALYVNTDSAPHCNIIVLGVGNEDRLP